VLAEVVLVRQQLERESTTTTRHTSETTIIVIWNKFIEELVRNIRRAHFEHEGYEDVNVEHFQLLVFFFHGLTLMQKKSIWLQLCEAVINVADFFQPKEEDEDCSNELRKFHPLLIARLLLLVDYMLHYFYDIPPVVVNQVQYNLFGIHCAKKEEATAGAASAEKDTKRRYFVCNELEESFTKHGGGGGHKQVVEPRVKPQFYNIGPAEYGNQDTPKIDGLACSFMLSNPEVLNYTRFYDAVLTLLSAGSKCWDIWTEKQSILETCSVHYHFMISWRLLSCLPPSTQFLSTIESSKVPSKSHARQLNLSTLHSLRWIPRLSHKSFQVWTKDCLVKQGLTVHGADALLEEALAKTTTVDYDVAKARDYLNAVRQSMVLESNDGDDTAEFKQIHDMPEFEYLCVIDAVVGRVHAVLDNYVTQTNLVATGNMTTGTAVVKDTQLSQWCVSLLEQTVPIIHSITVFVRSLFLFHVNATPVSPSAASSIDTPQTIISEAMEAYNTVLCIGSSRSAKVNAFGQAIQLLLPTSVRLSCEKWSGVTCNEFPAVLSWRNAFASDVMPVESYLDAIQLAHLSNLSGMSTTAAALNTPLKQVLVTMKHVQLALVRLCADLYSWCPESAESVWLDSTIFPIFFDATAENLSEHIGGMLDGLVGLPDSDPFTTLNLAFSIKICHRLLLKHTASSDALDERVLHECLSFLESTLDKPLGKVELAKYYAQNGNLTQILMSTANAHRTPAYATKVLKFFNHLLLLADKNPSDQSYQSMCMALRELATLDSSNLLAWLTQMILPMSAKSAEEETIQENRMLLQSLTSLIVKGSSHVGENVARTILDALIPMGSVMLSSAQEVVGGFTELMLVMTMLAASGSGAGHATLFKAAVQWLDSCKTFLSQKNVVEKLEDGSSETDGKHQVMLDSACCLLAYVKDVLYALKCATNVADRTFGGGGVSQSSADVDLQLLDVDSDAGDDTAMDEDESLADDSDDESLNNKLCTYTLTQKEFMNQHWYHCHTCKMVDGVGVCTVCAKVCHKDHDLSYAKYGSFFCDCGAKDDNRCQALTKRSASTSGNVAGGSLVASGVAGQYSVGESAVRSHAMSSSDAKFSGERSSSSEKVSKLSESFIQQILSCKVVLMEYLTSSGVHTMLIDLLQYLMPSIVVIYEELSATGGVMRAQQAIRDLRDLPKTIEHSDTLMMATLGSQEGAFENVRINFGGDQGTTIRQLVTSHVLRRIGMCCLTSPHGKRQHLAVSTEKGKVTILQLSALLKQAHSSKRKLTLTRLSSATIPFTVLTIAGSPCNEDFLAVCGLRDCHILTFTATGSVADHLVLHPTLDTGNFIIKAAWLAGSQTELALITADFVKIYDLAVDAISPQYYFLLPTGKVRDVTFMYTESDGVHLLVMGSTGYIYTQVLDSSSSAKQGPFYITNILDIKHAEIKETGGLIAGGGVSVYYSHTMQLLFFSYLVGRSFVAPISKITSEELSTVFMITLKSSNGAKSSTNGLALVQWTEVHNHPGLICCVTQVTNNPVVLLVKPDTIVVQEIKVVPAKAKIQDMVAIRHLGSNSDQRTTLILLCEDGSLRIYIANVDQTNYWMSSALRPRSTLDVLRPSKKRQFVSSGMCLRLFYLDQ